MTASPPRVRVPLGVAQRVSTTLPAEEAALLAALATNAPDIAVSLNYPQATHRSAGCRHWIALSAVLVGLAVLLSGCGLTGGKLLYFMGVGRGSKIEAQFEIPPGMVLILVDDQQGVVQWPQARQQLAEKTATELLEHKAVTSVVSYRTIERLRRTDSQFERRSAHDIGRHTDADVVIWLEVADFHAPEDVQDTDAAARMSVAVKVLDVHAETAREVRLWPRERDGHVESIELRATQVHSLKGKNAIATALTERLARNIARLFYRHTAGDLEDDRD